MTLKDELEPEIGQIRANEWGIDPLILNRWSPRAFLEQPVPDAELMAVLDAARWAPSCFNEQPWRYLVARHPEDRARLLSCLTPGNQSWARRAPVLLAVISHPLFALDAKPNRWGGFDSGTSWGYLALEAHRRGMIAHAMGGFSVRQVRDQFNVPEAWGVHAVIALGYRGPRETLDAEQQEREHPSTRKPLEAIWAEGRFNF